jgi:hypothetical protein
MLFHTSTESYKTHPKLLGAFTLSCYCYNNDNNNNNNNNVYYVLFAEAAIL